MSEFWLYLVHLYRQARVSHAKQFASELEVTILAERKRARDAVHHAELMEARAAIARCEKVRA